MVRRRICSALFRATIASVTVCLVICAVASTTSAAFSIFITPWWMQEMAADSAANHANTTAQGRSQLADGSTVGSPLADVSTAGVKRLPPLLRESIRTDGTARYAEVATNDATWVSQHLAQAAQCEQAGDLQVALGIYERALRVDRTNRQTLIRYARLQHRLGDLDAAIVTYRTCLGYYPNDPAALNDLAICFARAGELDSAIATMRLACNLQPGNFRYVNNLAMMLVETNEQHAAYVLLLSTFGDAAANYNLAHIAAKRGDYVQACRYLHATLELDPQMQQAHALRQQLEWLCGNVDLDSGNQRYGRCLDPDALEPLLITAPEPAEVIPVTHEPTVSTSALRERAHQIYLQQRQQVHSACDAQSVDRTVNHLNDL